MKTNLFTLTFTANTSGAGLTVEVGVYDSYDKAIERQIEIEKQICEWNSIDFETATNDGLHEDGNDWTYYSSDELVSTMHYQNTEDDYYIDIRPVTMNIMENTMEEYINEGDEIGCLIPND